MGKPGADHKRSLRLFISVLSCPAPFFSCVADGAVWQVLKKLTRPEGLSGYVLTALFKNHHLCRY